MPLRATNLNLLPVLQALLSEASITRAAAKVNLSQPAMSAALGRLRLLLGDPLLVKVGRTMRLTPRARQLRPVIDSVCGTIETLLLHLEFVPAHAHRDFIIAAPDYVALLLGPALIEMVGQHAPGVSVHFADVGADYKTRLAQGDIDVAVIAHVDGAVRGFSMERGYYDRLVGVVAADHPLAGLAEVGAADLARYPRLGIAAGLHDPTGAIGHPATAMADGDGPLKLSASHLLVLPLLVARTRGVAMLPSALAAQAAQLAPIVCLALPGPPRRLEMCMIWSPIHDSDPAHRWFLGVLGKELRKHYTTGQPAHDAGDP